MAFLIGFGLGLLLGYRCWLADDPDLWDSLKLFLSDTATLLRKGAQWRQ